MRGASSGSGEREISSVPTNKASAQATPSHIPLVHFHIFTAVEVEPAPQLTCYDHPQLA